MCYPVLLALKTFHVPRWVDPANTTRAQRPLAEEAFDPAGSCRWREESPVVNRETPHGHLLVAILLRAFNDLIAGDEYGAEELDCMCDFGDPPHGKSDAPCPIGRRRTVTTAKAWIVARSMEPFGFGWVASALGRDPKKAAAGMLAAAKQYGRGNRTRYPNWRMGREKSATSTALQPSSQDV